MDAKAVKGDGRQDWERDEGESRGDAESGVARVYEQTRRVREDFEGLVSAVLETRSTWESTLRERLTERPYLGLATAAGVGYVLGAGLSPGMIRATLALGTRVAFAVMMRRLAVPMVEIIAGRAPERTVAG